MKKTTWALVIAVACLFVASGCASNVKTIPVATISGEPQPIVETQLPEEKQTVLGLYASAREAYEQWKANPEKVKILDCRTPEEYAFVGHAPMAYNTPKKFFTYKYNEKKKKPVMKDNENYVNLVRKILVISDLGERA